MTNSGSVTADRKVLSAGDLERLIGVSRETFGRLSRYLDHLTRWQKTLNLVSANTLGDPWRRHILDSAQLYSLLPDQASGIIDLGSGAGFPGLVLAVMGAGPVDLVESDGRKCAFLEEVIRDTDAPAQVHRTRIEDLDPARPAQVITARACAPLPKLLSLAYPLAAPGATFLFLKGQNVDLELTESQKSWSMRVERYSSTSDPAGTVLRLTEVTRGTN